MTKKKERLSLQKRLQGVTMPISRKRIRWGRNWLCLCGSNVKYKRCCMAEVESITSSDGNARVQKLHEDIQGMINAQIEAKNKGVEGNG